MAPARSDAQLQWPLAIANKVFLFLFILFLPTQLGKHFFLEFSYISGIRVDYLAPTIYLTDGIVFLLFLFNFRYLFRFLKNPKVILLLLLLGISVLFSLSKEIAVYRYMKVIEFMAVFTIAQKYILKDKIILFAFAAAGLTQLFLSTMQFVYKHSLQGVFYFLGERYFTLSTPGIAKASLEGVEILRPYGTFSHPNSLAGFYVLLYFFVLTSKRFQHVPLLRNVIIFVSSLLIFFSFSKIAISVFIILTIIYMFRSRLKNNCRLCMISRLIILSILSVLFLRAASDPLSVQKRVVLLQNAVTIISSFPFFGVGPGNYLVSQNTLTQQYPTFLNQPVHNIFLLILSELGIIVTGVFIIMFYKRIASFLFRHPYIVTAVLITGFFDHYWITLQQNSLFLAFVLGSILRKD